MSDNNYDWIIEQYNEFKKLPATEINIQPYYALGTAILKQVVVDLYAAHKRDDKHRIEAIHSMVSRNGICEMLGMDVDYLDRLARTKDCRKYVYRKRDK